MGVNWYLVCTAFCAQLLPCEMIIIIIPRWIISNLLLLRGISTQLAVCVKFRNYARMRYKDELQQIYATRQLLSAFGGNLDD